MKKVKVLTALSAVSVASILAASPAFALTVDVTGNGANSSSNADISVKNVTTITQTNTADINNNVDANANTGGNNANENTGGNTSINTGDATTKVNLNNQANSNSNTIACCDPIAAAISVSGNGADSKNKVSFNINNIRNVTTENNLDIHNNVDGNANTGDNNANENTGGNSSIKTGDANVNITIGNSGNSNTVVIGGITVPTPPAPVVAAPIPGVSTVLGLTSKSLPMTGFDYPFQLIFGLTGALIGLGLVMKTKAVEIEKALSNLTSKISLG